MANSLGDSRLGKVIFETILHAPPSCIEFSLIERAMFVVGYYSLQERSDDSAEAASAKEDDSPQEIEIGRQQERNGSLVLFRLQEDFSVIQLQRCDTSSAVLDVHFSPHEPEFLATALSNGTVRLDRLLGREGSTEARLEQYKTFELFDASVLVLSLAWCPDISLKSTIAVPLSDGRVATFHSDSVPASGSDASTPLVEAYDAHSLEAWTVVWSAPTTDGRLQAIEELKRSKSPASPLLYSGGDDSTIRCWDPAKVAATKANDSSRDMEEALLPADLALERHPVTTSHPGILVDAKTHDAGVTAILPLTFPMTATTSSLQENEDHNYERDRPAAQIIATGSYDEFIRILLVPALPSASQAENTFGQSVPSRSRSPRWKTLAEARLGGGVWRLKLLRQRQTLVKDGKAGNGAETGNGGARSSFLILASCMHAGPKVVLVTCTTSSSPLSPSPSHSSAPSQAPSSSSPTAKDEPNPNPTQTKALESGTWTIRIVSSLAEGGAHHQSMNYGSDALFFSHTQKGGSSSSSSARAEPQNRLEAGRGKGAQGEGQGEGKLSIVQSMGQTQDKSGGEDVDQDKAKENEEQESSDSTDGLDNLLILSTSFYDRKLCVWKSG